MSKKKVVLAFSGGLDTSYCVKYLSQEKGFEVHAALVNTGGFSQQEINDTQKRAEALGVASFISIDCTQDFYDECVKFLVYGNVLKNNTYPLSVSAERIFQARAIADFAVTIKADAIAHGSTGAGNDQVRFDMIFQTMAPCLEIITPVRDQKLSREQEIDYLKKAGVAMNFDKAHYSVNKGLWGTSVGGRETLTSHTNLPETAYPTQVSKQEPENVVLHFKKGELIGLNDDMYSHPVEAIQALEALAAPFGIGRDVHVGDTIIGIKGRVGFEAAASLVIIKAHHLLEKHTLTKWQLYWKDQLAAWYGNWLHEGQLLDPVMRNLEAFMTDSQKTVSGKVFVSLLPYRFLLNGIESPHDLHASQVWQIW